MGSRKNICKAGTSPTCLNWAFLLLPLALAVPFVMAANESTTTNAPTPTTTNATTTNTSTTTDASNPTNSTTDNPDNSSTTEGTTSTTTEPTTTTTTPTTTTTTEPPPVEIEVLVTADPNLGFVATTVETNWRCGFYDERCRAPNRNLQDCVSKKEDGDGGTNKLCKLCDPDSHLQCFPSIRHNYLTTCQCEEGAVRNPYDRHRCIPNENHFRQHGETCIEADDEECDYYNYLECVLPPNATTTTAKPNLKDLMKLITTKMTMIAVVAGTTTTTTTPKPDIALEDAMCAMPSSDPVPRCRCVIDKYIRTRFKDGKGECYLNRDKYPKSGGWFGREPILLEHPAIVLTLVIFYGFSFWF